MKVLVTGGAGFIGEHFTKKLLKENYEVVIVDNFSSGMRNEITKDTILYDVNIEDEVMGAIFLKEKPDYVVHLAAQVSVNRSIQYPFVDCLTNITGTVNLLENSIKYNVKKFVFASSAAIYGEPVYLPIDELHPQQPISFYSLSKMTAEKYIILYEKLFGLNYCITRFSNVYGPGQNSDGEAGVISIFLDRIIANKSPIVYGGEQTRDFVYVKDVANAIYKAMKYENNEIFNISSNTETKINDLLKLMIKTIRNDVTPEFKCAREGDIVHSKLDNTRISKLLNWSPSYSLKAGLDETIFYTKQRNK